MQQWSNSNNYPRRPKKSNVVGKVILALFILILISAFVAFWYWNSLQGPKDSDSQTKAFVVRKGEGPSIIAENLEEEGLIKSAMAFKFIYKSNYLGQEIEAGDYKIASSMSVREIIDQLIKPPVDRWTTLLEGWRVEQMAEVLSAELGISNSEFITKAAKYEGYLFPDTYLFNKEATVDTIISTLRNTFAKRYNVDLQAKIRAKGLTPEEGVILASIVEREGRSDKVRTEIAGIMIKRYKMGMGLNADATVQYAKDSQALKQKGKLEKYWQPITRAEYQSVVSSYNTYLHAGFPPTPIANPSLSSLNAVANSNPNTPYVYYYHDPQGNSYYARTLEEHNANVANHR